MLPEEEERLTPALTGSLAYLRDIVDLYINTGSRANELLRLTLSDVDLHRDIVRIDCSKPDEYREVPLNETSRRIFQELVRQAEAKGLESPVHQSRDWSALSLHPKGLAESA
jgi:integrase